MVSPVSESSQSGRERHCLFLDGLHNGLRNRRRLLVYFLLMAVRQSNEFAIAALYSELRRLSDCAGLRLPPLNVHALNDEP
jgi:hypothetical protein